MRDFAELIRNYTDEHGNAPPGHLHEDVANKFEEMHDAMNEFCDRVEVGEVRSRKTYAKFKAILER